MNSLTSSETSDPHSGVTITAFWELTPPVRRFGGTCSRSLHAIMIHATSSSETFVSTH
jgi:hypothetical protein